MRELNGAKAMERFATRTYLATLPIVLLYAGSVALFSEPSLNFSYGSDYGRYHHALALFSLSYVLLHPIFILTSLLSAKHLTSPIFVGNSLAALIGVAVGCSFIESRGVTGAVLGMVVGSVIVNAILLLAQRASRRSSAVARPAPN